MTKFVLVAACVATLASGAYAGSASTDHNRAKVVSEEIATLVAKVWNDTFPRDQKIATVVIEVNTGLSSIIFVRKNER